MKEDNDICQVKCLHDDRVKRVEKKMVDDGFFNDLAEFFKALADPTRAKILFALAKEELCVCDISHILKMSDSAVSHQLRVLRNTRLVRHRKEGRIVYYSLDDKHIELLLEQGMEHINEKR